MPTWSAESTKNINQRSNKTEVNRSPDAYSNKEILKNWTFIICMKNILRDPKDQENLDNLANSYFKFIQAPKEDFEKLRQIALKYAALNYNDGRTPVDDDSEHASGDYNMHKCINLYNSKELERVTRKIDLNIKRIPSE
jgi:hypothetical protein